MIKHCIETKLLFASPFFVTFLLVSGKEKMMVKCFKNADLKKKKNQHLLFKDTLNLVKLFWWKISNFMKDLQIKCRILSSFPFSI